tara:strand:- start:803 stop:1099 length:297 start_codon:yes stop_codon:yes gene_type:complete
MALKFDGTKLKDGSKTIANVNGDKIREGTGIRTLANVKGDKIREGTGIKTLANVNGDKIREGTGIKTIFTMRDVDKAISINGRVSDGIAAALYLLFVK